MAYRCQPGKYPSLCKMCQKELGVELTACVFSSYMTKINVFLNSKMSTVKYLKQPRIPKIIAA